MADLAILRESGLNVIGVGGAVEVLEMAAPATRTQPVEVAGAMAGRAFKCGMHSGQCEPREFKVIERGPLPVIHVVTLLAGDRKTGRLVIGKAGLLELRRMAGNTLDG